MDAAKDTGAFRPARWLTGLLASAVALTLLVAPVASGSGVHERARRISSLVLHARYRLVGGGISGVFTNGSYLLTVAGEGLASTSTLTSDRTATRAVVSHPGCYVDALNIANPFGGPWLMFRCDQADQRQGAFELYKPSTGEWKPVAVSPQIIAYREGCGGDPSCAVKVVALGADWVEWDESCRGCAETFVFQSIATSVVQQRPPGWQPGGTTIPDLNSPSLSARLCSPVQVPQGFDSAPGALSFHGPFAVAFAWPSATGYRTTQIYVQRCGSRRRTTIVRNVSGGYPFAANSQAVVSPAAFGSRTLHGLFFDGLRRFTMNLPPVHPSTYQLALTARHLYVLGGDGKLWVGPGPSLPRP
jgi:hypothetical protein